MPRGDRTGPFGEGPRTGRQMGYCAGNESPGFAGMQTNWKGTGRGFGRIFNFYYRKIFFAFNIL